MFDRLKRLYAESKITINGLRKSVVKGWITEEQFKEITGEEY